MRNYVALPGLQESYPAELAYTAGRRSAMVDACLWKVDSARYGALEERQKIGRLGFSRLSAVLPDHRCFVSRSPLLRFIC